MNLLIRNMVCRHCVAAVTGALKALGLDVRHVELGVAELGCESLTPGQLSAIDGALDDLGFQRIVDGDDLIVERVKQAVMEHVRTGDGCNLNLSACIESHLGMSYDTASRVFSAREGRTIEKYYISQKIERVKELLGYRELTLSEIAFRTGYSSVAHLSRQFKAATGLTPTEYVRTSGSRKGLDEV